MSELAPPASTGSLMKERALRQFEGWADSYDRSILHHFLFRPSYLVLMEEIATWHREHQYAFRVLDIGCGTGELAGMLAQSDWPVETVGLDYSPAMCTRARHKTSRVDLGHRAGFTAGDSEFLPFADGSFDLVTCSNSFHHYPSQQAVVKNVHRLLKPGGRFMLIDGFRDNIVGWIAFDVIINRVEGNVYHAPWSVIDRYFRNAGFVNISRRKFNFWLPLCATMGDA